MSQIKIAPSILSADFARSYIPASTAKIARLRAMLNDIGSEAGLEVDGGVNPTTIAEVVKAGATVLVVESAIFNNRALVVENVKQLRALLC